MRSRVSKLVLACFCVGLFIALSASVVAAQPVDKKEILKQARQSYYSLKDQGLVEFQCAIVPNWRLLLTEQKLASDAVDRAVLLLDKVHFSVSVSASGEAKVAHNDVAVENKQ